MMIIFKLDKAATGAKSKENFPGNLKVKSLKKPRSQQSDTKNLGEFSGNRSRTPLDKVPHRGMMEVFVRRPQRLGCDLACHGH